MKSNIDSAAFRQMMGCFATGVAVVTGCNDELGPFGLTINSLTSVSLDPPLILFCLDKDAALYKHFLCVETFAINFLSHGQEEISRHFASRHHHAKPKSLWDKSQQDCPILRGTLGWMVCRTHAKHKGGDHTIFVGETTSLYKRAGTQEPLIYFHGRYRDLKAAGKVTSGARK